MWCPVNAHLPPSSGTHLPCQGLIPHFESYLLSAFCLTILACSQGLGSFLLVPSAWVLPTCLLSFLLQSFLQALDLSPFWAPHLALEQQLHLCVPPQLSPYLSPSSPITFPATQTTPELLLHEQLTLHPQLCRRQANHIPGINSIIFNDTQRVTFWTAGFSFQKLEISS